MSGTSTKIHSPSAGPAYHSGIQASGHPYLQVRGWRKTYLNRVSEVSRSIPGRIAKRVRRTMFLIWPSRIELSGGPIPLLEGLLPSYSCEHLSHHLVVLD